MDGHIKDTRKVYFEYYRIKRSLEFMDQHDGQRAWQGLQGRIGRRRGRRVVLSLSSAAAVVVLMISGFYLYTSRFLETGGEHPEIVSNLFPEAGSKRAFLTLADGQQVDLSCDSGRIGSMDAGMEISNANQRLVYKSTKRAAVARFNTLAVPRGAEYQVVLSDGTKVWINAESSLRYAEVFGDTREVILSGEAYFEVAKDAGRPFVVRMGENSVEVLGTHFNVSAYPGNEVYTTLVEGKVKVDSRSQSVVLSPDDQAVIEPGKNRVEVRKVDASRYVSWIKGSYVFKDTELKDIVAQLSRWYDVDIRFTDENLKYKRFAGVIYRDEELGLAIEVIERVANVRFVRDGKVIYVNNPE